MLVRIMTAVCVLALAGSRPPAGDGAAPKDGGNLVCNGDFSKGLEAWHTTFPEANETKYAKNHECVAVAAAPGAAANAKAVRFTLTQAVADSQGVKAVTPLMEVDPAASYEFGAELLTRGPAAIIFIEGYRRDPSQTVAGNDQYPGFVRCYRATIFPKCGPGVWSPQARTVELGRLQGKYRPTHLLIKLYAFHPAGEIFFRNVFLRKVEKKADASVPAALPMKTGAAPAPPAR